MNNLSRYFFAAQCIFCGRIFNDFCFNCLLKCEFIETDICIECKNFSPGGVTHTKCLKRTSPTILYVVFNHKGKVESCIKRSKSFHKEFASLKDLCTFGIKLSKKNLFMLDTFWLMSVPLSKRRFKQRGFNQSNFIASFLSSELGLKIIKRGILRIKATEEFVGDSGFEKKKVLLNSFKADPSIVKNKKILIVDDVFYTGCTMLELAKTLYNAGAKEVRCFAISRAMKLDF